MAKKTDSAEREIALLRAARKEAEALKAAARPIPPGARPAARSAARVPAPPAAPSAARTAMGQPTVLGWDHPAARPGGPSATTPLEHPTVDGWNHPAARDAEPKVKVAAEEQWARLAVVMEEEQRVAREKRAKLRRFARYALVGATVVILLVVMRALA